MSTPRVRRDLLVAGGCAAFIVSSLLLVRILTASTGDTHTAATQSTITTAAPQRPMLSSTLPLPGTTASPTNSPSNPGPIRGPVRTVALNPGVSVTPRPMTPSPAAAAPTTGLPATLPAVDDLPTDPTTAQATAAAWITALCTYDWQQPDPTTHQHRAQAYGDTTMPPAADPFTFDSASWTQIMRTHQSSACTDTIVTVDPAPGDHPGTSTIRITTTQLIAVDRTPIQQMTLHLTRTLEQTDTGNWRLGRPVTAN